jgi:hypothetical protein
VNKPFHLHQSRSPVCSAEAEAVEKRESSAGILPARPYPSSGIQGMHRHFPVNQPFSSHSSTASAGFQLKAGRYVWFAALLILCLCGSALAQDMAAKDCGACHESQFKTWLLAKHNTEGVVCAACHGAFHSGSLNACTACHTGEHSMQYKNWQFVKDYMVEGDTSDYYCIVCHDPHNPKKAKVLLCNSCHGSPAGEIQPRKGFRMSLQKAHDVFAEVGPNMDEDAWNHRIKSTSGKLMIGGGMVLLACVLLFPYFYTGFAFLRWVRRKFTKRS